MLGGASVLGVSTHADAEIQSAADEGADYVFVGTVYESASHPGRAGRGVEALAQARAVPLLAIAIGGIDVGKTPDVVQAGAHGVAVISGVWRAPHPRNALIRYVDALDAAMR
jgi:thiamine-phosphate diphosphorylase